MSKRIIKDNELLVMIDCNKAMNRLACYPWRTRLRILRWLVERELGDNYKIVKD